MKNQNEHEKRCKAIQLNNEGVGFNKILQLVQRGRGWLSKWLKRFKGQGFNGLKDKGETGDTSQIESISMKIGMCPSITFCVPPLPSFKMPLNGLSKWYVNVYVYFSAPIPRLLASELPCYNADRFWVRELLQLKRVPMCRVYS